MLTYDIDTLDFDAVVEETIEEYEDEDGIVPKNFVKDTLRHNIWDHVRDWDMYQFVQLYEKDLHLHQDEDMEKLRMEEIKEHAVDKLVDIGWIRFDKQR